MVNEVDGFSNKTSHQFVENIKKFKMFMVEHPFLKLDIPTKKNKGTLFGNKKIVMTGFRNNTIIEFIEANGGSINNTISKHTDLLVIKDENSTSTKKQAAELLGIPITTLDTFIKKYL